LLINKQFEQVFEVSENDKLQV